MIELNWPVVGPLLVLGLFIGGGIVMTYLQTVKGIQEKIFAAFDAGGVAAVDDLYEVLAIEHGTFWVDWAVEDHRFARVNLGLENMQSGNTHTVTCFRELMPGLPTTASTIVATVAVIRRPWRKDPADHLAFMLTWNSAY